MAHVQAGSNRPMQLYETVPVSPVITSNRPRRRYNGSSMSRKAGADPDFMRPLTSANNTGGKLHGLRSDSIKPVAYLRRPRAQCQYIPHSPKALIDGMLPFSNPKALWPCGTRALPRPTDTWVGCSENFGRPHMVPKNGDPHDRVHAQASDRTLWYENCDFYKRLIKRKPQPQPIQRPGIPTDSGCGCPACNRFNPLAIQIWRQFALFFTAYLSVLEGYFSILRSLQTHIFTHLANTVRYSFSNGNFVGDPTAVFGPAPVG